MACAAVCGIFYGSSEQMRWMGGCSHSRLPDRTKWSQGARLVRARAAALQSPYRNVSNYTLQELTISETLAFKSMSAFLFEISFNFPDFFYKFCTLFGLIKSTNCLIQMYCCCKGLDAVNTILRKQLWLILMQYHSIAGAESLFSQICLKIVCLFLNIYFINKIVLHSLYHMVKKYLCFWPPVLWLGAVVICSNKVCVLFGSCGSCSPSKP